MEEKRARRVTREPSSVRRSQPVDPAGIDRLHATVNALQIDLSGDEEEDTTPGDLRRLYARVRVLRNKLSRILGWAMPRDAALRADLVRMDEVISAEGALLSEKGVAGSNAEERKARLYRMLKELHQSRADIKADLALVEGLISHVKYVRDELRYAFEEGSRQLAALDLQYRVEDRA